MSSSSSDDASEVDLGSLRVNTAFAARYDEESRRAQAQRKADLVASVEVPERVFRAFNAAIASAAKSTSLCATPLAAVAVIVREHRLNVGSAMGGLAGHAPAEGSEEAADVNRFLANGPGRAAVAKLLRWARAAAHQARVAAGPQAKALTSPSLQKAATIVPATSTTMKRSRPTGATPSIVEAIAAPNESVPSTSTTTKRSRPTDVTPSIVEAIALNESISVTACAQVLPVAPNLTKMHGRGAGRGCSLGPHGEPLFEHLHPSWRARRVVHAAHRKAIHLDLRKKR